MKNEQQSPARAIHSRSQEFDQAIATAISVSYELDPAKGFAEEMAYGHWIARELVDPQPEPDTDCPYHIGTGIERKQRTCPFGQKGDPIYVAGRLLRVVSTKMEQLRADPSSWKEKWYWTAECKLVATLTR